MRDAGNHLDAISLHYYTTATTWTEGQRDRLDAAGWTDSIAKAG